MKTITFIYNDEELELPARWEVCSKCDGEGRQGHPAFSNGITGSEWAEWDEEERQYYLNGMYDIPCTACEGRTTVLVVDRAASNRHILALYDEMIEEEERFRRMQAAEMRNCGW